MLIPFVRLLATVLFLIPFATSCVSTKVLGPDNLELVSSKDIVVSTYNGRVVRMLKGNYGIVTVGNTHHIRGKGVLFLNSQRTDTKPFSGDISFGEIKYVEVRKKSPFYYTGPILFGVAAGLIVLVALTWSRQ